MLAVLSQPLTPAVSCASLAGTRQTDRGRDVAANTRWSVVGQLQRAGLQDDICGLLRGLARVLLACCLFWSWAASKFAYYVCICSKAVASNVLMTTGGGNSGVSAGRVNLKIRRRGGKEKGKRNRACVQKVRVVLGWKVPVRTAAAVALSFLSFMGETGNYRTHRISYTIFVVRRCNVMFAVCTA